MQWQIGFPSIPSDRLMQKVVNLVHYQPECSEKAMAPHSSTLAWKIPWTEEPGSAVPGVAASGTRLSSFAFTFNFHHWRRKWQPTPMFLPENPRDGEPGGLPSMGSHRVGRVLKPMHPTKFLGCNSWTLPFPIPAGGQGPAGLQSARSRAGPAGQSSGCWPLDLQRTLGCLGKPRGSDLSAKGWSGQGLEPKGEAFLRPPGCANRGEKQRHYFANKALSSQSYGFSSNHVWM